MSIGAIPEMPRAPDSVHNEHRHPAGLCDKGGGAAQEELLELGLALAGHDDADGMYLHGLAGDDVADAVRVVAPLGYPQKKWGEFR